MTTLDAFLLTLGLAILKYRLYDIDLVINKTLVYSAFGVLIACAYVAVVVGIGALIGTRGESNLALSLVATAIVAVAFQPLRERLQRLANQVVYGQRLSPYDVLSEFSRRMAEALSADDVFGYAHMQSLLVNHRDQMDAVFVANDLMTLGALTAINAAGLRIPGDVSVVGFDDMPWAASLNPPLTTVGQPRG